MQLHRCKQTKWNLIVPCLLSSLLYHLIPYHLFSSSGDRGHLTRRAAAAWGATEQDAKKSSDDTFYYTNAALQHQNFNQDEWLELENWVLQLELDSNGKISVITGPIFGYGGFDRTVKPEGRRPADVPAGFFKAITFINRQDKLDVRAFVMLQDEEALRDTWGRRMFRYQRYQVSTEEIERLTGLAFAPQLSSCNPVADDEPPIEVDGPKEIVGPDGQRIVVRDSEIPVYIAAALVNPAGDDEENEWVSIINLSNEDVSLDGWKLKDPQDVLEISSGSLAPGQAARIMPLSPIRLGNRGGSISLFKGEERVDRVKYPKQSGSLAGKPVLFFWRTPMTTPL